MFGAVAPGVVESLEVGSEFVQYVDCGLRLGCFGDHANIFRQCDAGAFCLEDEVRVVDGGRDFVRRYGVAVSQLAGRVRFLGPSRALEPPG